MKILLVTGRIAEKEVKRIAEKFGCDIYVADVDVASFLTPSHLKDLDLSRYDLVIVPGLAKGDWKKLEKEKGVKIRLGPVHFSDLPFVLKNIDKIELSHEVPACRLLNDFRVREILDTIDTSGDCKFKIGGVEVGGRAKIIAEIVDATELSDDELVERVEYYLESGADIIDLGIPIEFDYRDVRRVVKVARDHCDALSVDTFNRKAIEIAIEQGVDLIMSVSYENYDCVEVIKDVAVVAVERNLEKLRKLVEELSKKTEKIIADPLLDPPPKVFESLIRYYEFRRRNPDIPMLMGVGNVTELVDADSVGINALLACIAEEIGVELLFTTEASNKTKGCVRELRTAVYMSRASKLMNRPPKDLGFDLLMLKEKRAVSGLSPTKNIVEAEESKEFVRDPKGDFRIWIWNGRIVCEHESVTIVGRSAKEILDTVIRLNLVSRLDHAGYLGRELMKAEIALKLGKNYVQDEPLNFGRLINKVGRN